MSNIGKFEVKVTLRSQMIRLIVNRREDVTTTTNWVVVHADNGDTVMWPITAVTQVLVSLVKEEVNKDEPEDDKSFPPPFEGVRDGEYCVGDGVPAWWRWSNALKKWEIQIES